MPATARADHKGVPIRFSTSSWRISAESKGGPDSPGEGCSTSGRSIAGSCSPIADNCCWTIAVSNWPYTSILAPTSPNTNNIIPIVVTRTPITTNPFPRTSFAAPNPPSIWKANKGSVAKLSKRPIQTRSLRRRRTRCCYTTRKER
jgi:hypothetical protein